MARCFAPVILLLLAHLASSAPDQEDVIVLKQASETSQKYCKLAKDTKQISAEEGRKALAFGMGTDNPLYKILLSSKNPGDLTSRIQNEIGAGFVVSAGWPIVLSILVAIVFYGFVIWTCCCACCRPCVRHRKPDMLKKGAFAVALLLMLGCLIACFFVAVGGYGKISTGVVSAGCGAANLIHDALSGSDRTSINASSEAFIGIIPLVDTFNTLVGQLDSASSPLLSGLSSLLADTAKINEAVAFAEETLSLLRNTMADRKNTRPEDGGNTLYHECRLCEAIVKPLDEVVSQLRNGVATALKDTREEVKTQLDPSGARIKELRNNLYNTIKPMTEVKNQIRDTVGWFVKPDSFQQYADQTYGEGSTLAWAVMYAFLPLAAIILFGTLGLGCWHFQEKCQPEPLTDSNGSAKNPYLLRGPGVVGCTWCNSCFYAINILFIGGILVAVSVPVSGTCLVLADINYENAQNLLTSVGVIKDGKVDDNIKTVLTVMDRCLSVSQEEYHKQNMTSLNLLDMVTLNDGEIRQTARQLVVAKALDPVNTEFDKLEARLKSAPPSLSSSSELTAMRKIFSENSIGATYLANVDALRASEDYKAMEGTPASILYFTSLLCGNFTPSTGLDIDLQDYGASIPGIGWAWDTFSGIRIPGGSTGSTPIGQPTGDCDAASLEMQSCTDFDRMPWSAQKPNPYASYKAGCDAGSNYMRDVKNALLTKQIFQCRYPMTVVGGARVRCDPEKAKRDSSGQWIDTCLDKSTMKFDIQIQPCDLSEFTTYVKQFDDRLGKAFELADDAVAQTLDDVKVNMRGNVTEYVLNPIYGVVDGLQCNFMLEAWKSLLSGFCYNGAGGYIDLAYSYVGSAVGALFFGVAMYVFWRIMRDNWDAFGKEDAQGNSI